MDLGHLRGRVVPSATTSPPVSQQPFLLHSAGNYNSILYEITPKRDHYILATLTMSADASQPASGVPVPMPETSAETLTQLSRIRSELKIWQKRLATAETTLKELTDLLERMYIVADGDGDDALIIEGELVEFETMIANATENKASLAMIVEASEKAERAFSRLARALMLEEYEMAFEAGPWC